MVNFEIKNTNLVFKKSVYQMWTIKKYSYENFARPDHGFLYLASGNITYSFHNEKIELKPGDIIYLPKNSNYIVEFNLKKDAVEDYLINFDVAGEQEFTDHYKPTKILNDTANMLLDYFKDLTEAYIEKDKPFLIKALFYLCLNAMQTSIENKSLDQERLKFEKAAKILGENFNKTVDEIAKDLHMSRSAFQKKFYHHFSISPTKYRTNKRLKKATLLLATTDMPISEISDKLGFYDIAYFYKVFKKVFSMTPKEYRNTEKPSI